MPSGRKVFAFKSQDFDQLKQIHSSENLFEDPEFPATGRSIYYTKRVPRDVTWRRPHEICSNPKFIVGDAHRFDLSQGSIGNCWFIAAVSMITQRQKLFENVVPNGQTFDKPQYAGIFHFRFWQFGKWYDVVIDDRLPVFSDGSLVFCHNTRERNEFWAALLEKAYAKLSWSYEGLEAGQTTDALIDMTGGIEETYNMDEIQDRDAFWETIKKALAKDAMIGCNLAPDPRVREAKLPNGLVRGHAYAVTGTVKINVNGHPVRLVRCRNPWGNEVEWNGPWSDNDERWNAVDPRLKVQMNLKAQADGEFWMNYENWLQQFEQVQICHLGPDSFDNGGHVQVLPRNEWKQEVFDGNWVRGKNAGGSGQPDAARFWTNPQYLIEVKPDPTNPSGKIYIMASCLQKYTRQKRMQNGGRPAEEYIQIRIFKVDPESDNIDRVRAGETGFQFYPRDLERIHTSGPYINKREVACRALVEPDGYYVIVPSTYEPHKEGKFMVRIFTETESTGRTLQEDVPKKPTPVDFQYKDTFGVDPKFEIRQWWDSLPADEKARVMKMAVPVAGVCCCLMILNDLLRKRDTQVAFDD